MQLPAYRLQEESSANQEAKKLEIQAQIEAERRATEQYRVRPGTCKLTYLSDPLLDLHLFTYACVALSRAHAQASTLSLI